MRNSTRLLTCVGLSVGLALPALANDPSPKASPASSKPARDTKKATSNAPGDLELMTKIAQTSMKEIDAAKAASLASRKETRDFAQLMIKDHGKASDELKNMAMAKNIELPTMMDEGNRKAVDKLSTEKGIDLDRKYASMMVDDHEDAVELFEKTTKDAKDPELKAWATKTLPVMRSHHRMALELKSKLESLTMNE